MNQSEFEAYTRNRRQARENACDQVTIGFDLKIGWLAKWDTFFQPTTAQDSKRRVEPQITWETQLKAALKNKTN